MADFVWMLLEGVADLFYFSASENRDRGEMVRRILLWAVLLFLALAVWCFLC